MMGGPGIVNEWNGYSLCVEEQYFLLLIISIKYVIVPIHFSGMLQLIHADLYQT